MPEDGPETGASFLAHVTGESRTELTNAALAQAFAYFGDDVLVWVNPDFCASLNITQAFGNGTYAASVSVYEVRGGS